MKAHLPPSITPGAPFRHLLGELWQDLRRFVESRRS
jgi:hypothetical protein